MPSLRSEALATITPRPAERAKGNEIKKGNINFMLGGILAP